ncbi:serine hydrolase domain-containing protein [Alkalimonas sp. MEB108]|uniref:Serine hydrolase domain-containing protein n=1 Tax=Alkalimonas cellulosilytica TaxID=3058395 RepID=A0ABU7J9D8_9GAMM|nr:serine hydrolase domain-containing protein [Alkalimonas sp. MEB108]MEE2003144.1 serine hydrolase domain-containing protein [Alkalimonas sp. MEB108]
MTRQELQDLIAELANEFGVPGVAAGLWYRGDVSYVCHGVTSIENPLPIEEHTLFQAGSIGKTLTATALVLLEAQGLVALDAPVRRYVPELNLSDVTAGDQVTLKHLLNHTAGWEGDFFPDTGEGDNALAGFVDRLNELEQLTPPGTVFSYNNAAFCLAGRVIEKVTGETYESAIRRLILEPLGLHESFFFRDDVMTRRFAVGHKTTDGDALEVARPWGLPRNGAAAGGIVTSVSDLLAWARFHLRGARDDVEAQYLPDNPRLQAMYRPTLHMPGCAFGDAFGIGWFLTKVGNAWLVSHGGSTHGQEANLAFLPEHDWALVLLTNSSPGGMSFNEAATKRVLAACTGIVEPSVQTVSAAPSELAEYAGEYRARSMRCLVSVDESGEFVFAVSNELELNALMSENSEVPQSEPTVLRALLVREHADRYVFASGPLSGTTGYFERGQNNRVRALHLFGRWLSLVDA